jgi:hypothetical protein
LRNVGGTDPSAASPWSRDRGQRRVRVRCELVAELPGEVVRIELVELREALHLVEQLLRGLARRADHLDSVRQIVTR